jgi:hypothetical protein
MKHSKPEKPENITRSAGPISALSAENLQITHRPVYQKPIYSKNLTLHIMKNKSFVTSLKL